MGLLAWTGLQRGRLHSGAAKGADLAPHVAAMLFGETPGTLDATAVPDVPAVLAAPIVFGSSTSSLFCNSTGEEYEEFLKLMHLGQRPFRKPGISVRDEYEAWLAHRAKKNAAARGNRRTA